MNKLSPIETFTTILNESELKNYSEKLHENLKDLNSKENKYTLWLILAILVYFLSSTSTLFKINIGLVDNIEKTMILKLLPVVIAYILFNLNVIVDYKKDVTSTLNKILMKSLKLNDNSSSINSSISQKFIDMYLPFEFTSAIRKVDGLIKPTKLELLIGTTLVLPVTIVSISPYFIEAKLIYNIWSMGLDNSISLICFLSSIWIIFLIPFYKYLVIKKGYIY